MVVSVTTTFPSVPQVPSAFFQSDPFSPAILLGVREAILPSAGYSTCNNRSKTWKNTRRASL